MTVFKYDRICPFLRGYPKRVRKKIVLEIRTEWKNVTRHVKTVDVTIPRLTAGKSAVPRIFPWLSRFIFVTAETADFFRSCLFNCGFFPRLPVNLRFPRFILLPWTFPWYRGFPRGWALLVALLEFSVLWNCAASLFEQSMLFNKRFLVIADWC